MTIRTLDLFCGGGGSGWGARAAGAKVVCGVDAWNVAAETYRKNFPGARVLQKTLDEDSSPADLGRRLGKIDLILASPECTNHTCAKGAKPRDESSRRTARYILNFARELEPRWMVLENVVHMRSWHGYDPLIDELRELGYHVLPQVLNAVDFGVPQTRRRLFLLCDRQRMPDEIPIPTGTKFSAASLLDPLGTWPVRPLYAPKRAAGTIARAERAMVALGRGVPFLIVYYGTDGSGGWQPLDRPLRTLTTLDRFGLVTWQGEMPMLRMLQVPELRRAMGFDDGFCLDHGSRRDRIRLLGNGVCPPVMAAAVRSLMRRVPMALAAE